jgi:hypothetical protein
MLMFGICSPCLRSYSWPDDREFSRMEHGTPQPGGDRRPMADDALARRAASFALAFEPFAIRYDGRLRVSRRFAISMGRRLNTRTAAASVPCAGNHYRQAALSSLLKN